MIYYGNELYHHGIKGQKWGDRNYQYEDGSLTPEGKKRYGVGNRSNVTKGQNVSKKAANKQTESNAKTRTYGYSAGKRHGVKLEDRSIGKTVAGGIFETALADMAVSGVLTAASTLLRDSGRESAARYLNIAGYASSAAVIATGITKTVRNAKEIARAKERVGK